MKNLLSIYFISTGIVLFVIPSDDPRLVNFTIMSLYLVCAAWWIWKGHPADFCYWLSALAITATVTFGYTR